MATWSVQRYLNNIFILTYQTEVALGADLTILFHANVGIIAEAVGGYLAANARQQFTDNRIVHAHHRTTVERQIVQEVNKRLLQVFEVAMVGIHMIGFDIGHDSNHRL